MPQTSDFAVFLFLDRKKCGSQEDIVAMFKSHVSYGVKDSHYKMVGEALLWTLKQGLAKEWTKDLAEAWSVC